MKVSIKLPIFLGPKIFEQRVDELSELMEEIAEQFNHALNFEGLCMVNPEQHQISTKNFQFDFHKKIVEFNIVFNVNFETVAALEEAIALVKDNLNKIRLGSRLAVWVRWTANDETVRLI